jgi:hypothetical protein
MDNVILFYRIIKHEVNKVNQVTSLFYTNSHWFLLELECYLLLYLLGGWLLMFCVSVKGWIVQGKYGVHIHWHTS